MKKIRILLFIIIIMIIILVSILFAINIMNNNKPSEEPLNKVVEEEPEIKEGEISPENYIKVKKCIQSYINYINKNNTAYYGRDAQGKYAKTVKDDVIKEGIYKLLSSAYIKENNITKENVYNYVDDVTQSLIFNALDMKIVANDDISQYAVYGYLQTTDNKFVKYTNFIVNLNQQESTFSIEPINKNENYIKNIKAQNVTIEKNSTNVIDNFKFSSELICKEYFTQYKRMMLSNPIEAYKLLDKEYKEKRFGNVEEFKKYVTNNIKELQKLNLKEYNVNVLTNKQEYICKDENENIISFDVKNVTDYTVKLDTYTILTDKFKESYDLANDKNKVMLNVDKWIKMLNNRDYKTAFSVLDENFVKNKVKTQEVFEKYMRLKYPSYYTVSYSNFQKTNNYYTFTLKLKDIKSENTLDMNIVMRLDNDYNYVMSFEI